ncbi:MAG: hypothetical protein JO205_02420 [Pseudolabrys sp.]|nr:hypothetical protein [Pseudolabrys sp.]
MPNDVKAVVSAVVLVVAGILAWWGRSPVSDMPTAVLLTAVFMVVAMWIFPEAGVKKGDLKKVR